ncbi:hypothetical protein [Breznakiella homolactica]|uniref:Outer membrane protein beta-barrel domain-containing protein n=1 Tax=Breznakiella homolactica TaxID=2798577 RepID=A0A7T7XKI9_9SPIR|nr:hypothetical protein [Breznakiella homolactica]QQO08094.1 hypothetical protein JFL75_14245 [Breznakiella homolactica]
MNKKLILALCSLLVCGIPVFGKTENWMALRVQYGISWEKYYGENLIQKNDGVSLNGFGFLNKGYFGYFYDLSVAYPLNTRYLKTQYKPDFGIQSELMLGPAFRVPIFTEAIQFIAGIGAHAQITYFNGEPEGSKDLNYCYSGLGVGGTAAFRIIINSMSVDAGISMGYDFFCYDFDEKAWISDYKGFILRPFIGIGWML